MKLFMDACSIIYFIESQQTQGHSTRAYVRQALQDHTQVIVSRLSFLECRVLPLKENNTELLAAYHRFFQLPNVQIIELSAEVVNIATDLRVQYAASLRTPDALQLACALSAQAEQFLTGDKKLQVIREIAIKII